MSEDAAALLAAWLSPAYPVGAFAYSHGLEAAIAAGAIREAGTLGDWIADAVEHGAGRTDAILLAHAHAAGAEGDGAALAELAELAEALQPSAERRRETMAQGTAFAAVTAAVWGGEEAPAAYPIAVGRAAGRYGVPAPLAARLYLQAFASNLASAGVRLVPVGQTDGQRVVARLMPLCAAVAEEAVEAPLDDIGGAGLALDIAAMRHETLEPRLFRS